LSQCVVSHKLWDAYLLPLAVDLNLVLFIILLFIYLFACEIKKLDYKSYRKLRTSYEEYVLAS